MNLCPALPGWGGAFDSVNCFLCCIKPATAALHASPALCRLQGCIWCQPNSASTSAAPVDTSACIFLQVSENLRELSLADDLSPSAEAVGADVFDGRVDGLYIILISLHGLVRGDKMELGKDADTGGQVCGVYCWQPSAPGGDAGRLLTCLGQDGLWGSAGGRDPGSQVAALLDWLRGVR